MTKEEIIQEVKEAEKQMNQERHTITIAFPTRLRIDHLFNEELKINSLIFETEDINYFQDLEGKFVKAAVAVREYIRQRKTI